MILIHSLSMLLLNLLITKLGDIISNLLACHSHRVEHLCDRTFVLPICPSAHVSSGNTADCIRMPFGVVSGVGLGMGVLDFGGDRRRGRGRLGVNTMQNWRIDRLSTCV